VQWGSVSSGSLSLYWSTGNVLSGSGDAAQERLQRGESETGGGFETVREPFLTTLS
jgi:hypothetical protein